MGNVFSSKKESVLFPEFSANLQRLDGKIVAITGCTTGTGFFAAKLCAEKGAEVIMLNRPSERAKSALERVKEAAPGAKVSHIDCDLSDFESVKKAAAEIKSAVKKLNVLCNNAGVMAFPDTATKDGYDIQMQTNHLSHFLLTRELIPLLEAAVSAGEEGRVVNHSSLARKRQEELKAEYFGKNGGNLGGDGWGTMLEGPRWVRYQQTKLANMCFTSALHKKLVAAGSKVKVVVAAPGVADTNLLENIPGGKSDGEDGPSWVFKLVAPAYGALMMQSAEDGACPLLTAMFSNEVQSLDFYEPSGGASGPATKKEWEPHCCSEANEAVLWKASAAAVGEFEVPPSK